MSFSHNSNIGLGNNSGKSFDLVASIGLIIKELNKLFYFGKLLFPQFLYFSLVHEENNMD